MHFGFEDFIKFPVLSIFGIFCFQYLFLCLVSCLEVCRLCVIVILPLWEGGGGGGSSSRGGLAILYSPPFFHLFPNYAKDM